MEPNDRRPDRTQPLITVIASDEEVIVHVGGFAVLRALYEAEGYYDTAADGDPPEQDLYRIEVLDARHSAQAAEALDQEVVGALADLGVIDPTVRRLFPAARWDATSDGQALVEHYLMVLAAALARSPGPAERQRLLEKSAAWSTAVIEDQFQGLPDEWQQRVRPDH